MSDFGSRNMGFFGGSTTGGGGTSTGVNGLNGTTNIGLGGTLTSSTTILGNSGNYGLSFSDLFYFGLTTNDGFNIVNNNSNKYLSINANVSIPTSNFIELANYKDITLAGNNSSFRIFYNSIQSLFFSTSAGANTNFGIKIDFDSKETSLGDIDDDYNKTKIILYDTSGNIITYGANGMNGFWASPSFTQFGSNNGTKKLYFSIDYGLDSLALRTTADVIDGIELEVASKKYKFGSFNLGNTWIEVDDSATEITFNTESLVFTGANLQSSSPPLSSTVRYLLVTLNGVQYSILCTKTNLP